MLPAFSRTRQRSRAVRVRLFCGVRHGTMRTLIDVMAQCVIHMKKMYAYE
jgi:hypothetical protein